MTSADPTRFAIVGAGWRAEFYLRIAAALPDRFEVTGLLTRDPRKQEAIARTFGIASAATLDDLLADQPAFVVLATPRDTTADLLHELADRDVPTLAETPPAGDIEHLRALAPLAARGARIQVAEQYRFQPLHAARLSVARSGRLGRVTQAQVSVAHGYHGIDLIRRLLDLGREPLTITAHRSDSPIVAGCHRRFSAALLG